MEENKIENWKKEALFQWFVKKFYYPVQLAISITRSFCKIIEPSFIQPVNVRLVLLWLWFEKNCFIKSIFSWGWFEKIGVWLKLWLKLRL